MKTVFAAVLIFFGLFSGRDKYQFVPSDSIIGSGQMPNLTKDKTGIIHLVFGMGDTIKYAFCSDGGENFSKPVPVAVLPGLAASHTRGPQIAATGSGLLVTACTNEGNIYSYSKSKNGKWLQTAKINDLDTVAKENLMSLSADGNNAFAVWLDLRDKHNKIYGARSVDGGKTWGKNLLVYASPDTTVCECCKPSVVVKGSSVFVMFRNWLDGNRDLYLSRSANGGKSFSKAEKLGKGSWALKGCPMDGGAVVLNKKGSAETIWNRKGVIYTCKPGSQEVQVGMGRSCTMEIVNEKNVYAWVENGDVVVVTATGQKQNMGKGQLPVLKAIDNNAVLCMWENKKEIHKAIVAL